MDTRTLFLIAFHCLAFSLSGKKQEPSISTFSIVARDPATGEMGVAVQSKFIAVGSVVPYAKAGVGAIATQALGNTRYGPVGLELLSKGRTSQEVIRLMTTADPRRAHRQVGVMDWTGTPPSTRAKNAWTGREDKPVRITPCKEICSPDPKLRKRWPRPSRIPTGPWPSV